MLKPQISSTRELVSLDGLWKFNIIKGDLETEKPWSRLQHKALEAPVPASYNDLFISSEIHDHVGWVFYQRKAMVPRGWADQRYFIRVEAATHRGRVYVNDTFLVEHIGGYTPFETEVTKLVKPGEEFRLTIAVDNELSNITIPPGNVEVCSSGAKSQKYKHDFYNYAGLARSVWLYSTPPQRIEDITVVTDVKSDSSGVMKYVVKTSDGVLADNVAIDIVDESDQVVTTAKGVQGEIVIQSPNLWQPGAAYLYQFRVSIVANGRHVVDTYQVAIGIRSVQVKGNQFLINGKPFYFTGFGRHEDTPVRGKGHDQSYLVHDFQLMDWIGANSFRTSHYPYAEEVMDFADRHGIVVIDETPAVGLNYAIGGGIFGGIQVPTWSEEGCNDNTREAHADCIRELIKRDKNHASVVLWSIANEPSSSEKGAREYFEPLVKLTRELDPSRPITFANVMFARFDQCLISDLFDVFSLNRYYGWYMQTGDLASAEVELEKELRGWESKYGRPMIMTEYGADTVAGLHSLRDQPWSEEYQVKFNDMYHRVHDRTPGMVGEQVWNFADFATAAGIWRVEGNKKGIFTRDRKPKSIAHVLRKRWVGIRSRGNSKPTGMQGPNL
jgi:beta-glucuronidase